MAIAILINKKILLYSFAQFSSIVRLLHLIRYSMSQECEKVFIQVNEDVLEQSLPQKENSSVPIPLLRQDQKNGNGGYSRSQVILKKGKRQFLDDKTEIQITAKEPWTDQEELNLILAHKEHKNRWSDVAEALKGRSNNNIKNRFYSIFRKTKAKILKEDYSYQSLLELLELHYMTSLIEKYLSHPNPNARLKGKRGKDFIYSLIHNLNLNTAQEYHTKLSELSKKEGTMNELFDKLSASPSSQKIIPVEENKPAIEEKKVEKNEIPEEPTTGKNQCDQFLVPHLTLNFLRHANKPEETLLFKSPILGSKPREDIQNDASPLYGHNIGSPLPSMFSPTCLSAGPAAAAANFAANFCNKGLTDGFTEFSNELKADEHLLKDAASSSILRFRYPISQQRSPQARDFRLNLPNCYHQNLF